MRLKTSLALAAVLAATPALAVVKGGAGYGYAQTSPTVEISIPTQAGSTTKELRVTVLNKDGKYVVWDTLKDLSVKKVLSGNISLKKIEQGGTCTVPKGTTVYTVATLGEKIIVRAPLLIGGNGQCSMGVRFAMDPADFAGAKVAQ